jgi:outer membrane protein
VRLIRDRRFRLVHLICSGLIFCAASTVAQTQAGSTAELPAAPVPQGLVNQAAANQASIKQTSTTQATANQSQVTQLPANQLPDNQRTANPSSAASGQPATAAASTRLTLKEAEAIAIKNNPQISVAHLLALASHQVTREVKSNLWPQAVANVTGVDAESGSRITAGLLNNPTVYERAAAGVMVSQLITDFGRTYNLISSASYAEKAESQNAAATQQQILLAVNNAFFGLLQAQAVLTVAQQTVKERQTVADQVNALYQNKLKSELDYSFASVNLAQAQLLLLDAENNESADQATLSMVLGYPTQQNYQLVDERGVPEAPPPDINALIGEAFSLRPEILSLQFQYRSAKKFQSAERDLFFPTIQAIGAAGLTPFGNNAVAPNASALNNTYAAAGANMQVPLFNGFQYFARAKEAGYRAEATDERLRNMKDLISRDVRTSWLNSNTAYQRLSVTQKLLDQAKLALRLADSRYKLGLGSIVELSQAQLQETQAEIAYVAAGYDYRLSIAVLTYETTGI